MHHGECLLKGQGKLYQLASDAKDSHMHQTNILYLRNMFGQPIVLYKAIGRDRKNKAIYTTDIVAQGPGHSFWTTSGKGELRLTKSDDLIAR